MGGGAPEAGPPPPTRRPPPPPAPRPRPPPRPAPGGPGRPHRGTPRSRALSLRSLADSVHAVGEALNRLFVVPGESHAPAWAEQFSAVSHDQRDARCTVQALYRGATVRL